MTSAVSSTDSAAPVPLAASKRGLLPGIRDQVFGNLYLTDKKSGTEFDTDDEAVLHTLTAAAGVEIENARLYAGARRQQ
ncbi:GAF domain-containing protein [Streptomyces roseochromogenus]|uniref:GAF domain-containing protein n=1 Tax=Streptomyces roseochromogenus subsp. oscitans DS 12.976 TaxID=1352936 RepID=V6KWX3_STRRC|nr:hypothetical protein M878_01695 [Streptomyces roseochromogenus subsp. oscitans DS 12.976]